MKSVSTEAEALLDSGAVEHRDLVIVSFPSETFGFWNDVFAATFDDFAGVTFSPGLPEQSISAIIQSNREKRDTLTITLNGVDDAVLSMPVTYPLHQARIQVCAALYNPSSKALVTTLVWFDGTIDRDEFTDSDGVASVTYECTSRSAEGQYATNWKLSDTDQQRLHSGDRAMEFASKAGNQSPIVGSGIA